MIWPISLKMLFILLHFQNYQNPIFQKYYNIQNSPSYNIYNWCQNMNDEHTKILQIKVWCMKIKLRYNIIKFFLTIK